MWLSRSKFEAHAELSVWQKDRKLENEQELISRFKSGLQELCKDDVCEYTDADAEPEAWASAPPPAARRPQVRFTWIDPSVHTIETQINLVGHANILVALHGGALGLSLFLPPGTGAIFELHTSTTTPNYHFHNMAKMMGHGYERIRIESHVEVDAVWEILRKMVLDRLA